MPSSIKMLIKALEYIRTHEPIESLSSEHERIVPLLIFEKLHGEGYISGEIPTVFGDMALLHKIMITCKGLEYLETLKSKRARARAMSCFGMLLWAIIGALLTLIGQLLIRHI